MMPLKVLHTVMTWRQGAEQLASGDRVPALPETLHHLHKDPIAHDGLNRTQQLSKIIPPPGY